MNKVKKARMVLKHHRNQPNKSEEFLESFLNEHLPGCFMYNGGELTLEGKIPDFICINGEKAFIELAGRRFHTEAEMLEKERLYGRYGFRMLTVWYEQLKDEDQLLLDILIWFYKNIK